jgi:hypothetical protein
VNAEGIFSLFYFLQTQKESKNLRMSFEHANVLENLETTSLNNFIRFFAVRVRKIAK